MRTKRVFHAVDSHTEGMPTRVITGGVGPLPGATMLERKLRFEAERDDLRLLLMREPRGHAAMSGAILQPPTRDDADWGVLFIEVSGCLPMCGHGTIGVATVLVETGMVEVREPETVVRLDTPAGLVEALRKDVPEGAVVYSDLETSYRIAAEAPVYIAAAPPGHVADTEENRPFERRAENIRFFRTGDVAIPRRAGAGWLVLDRRRFDIVPQLDSVYRDGRYTLYVVP